MRHQTNGAWILTNCKLCLKVADFDYLLTQPFMAKWYKQRGSSTHWQFNIIDCINFQSKYIMIYSHSIIIFLQTKTVTITIQL